MTGASLGPPGLGKFGSTYPAYSVVGGPDILLSESLIFTEVPAGRLDSVPWSRALQDACPRAVLVLVCLTTGT